MELLKDYELVIEAVEQARRFTFEQFRYFRLMASSRIFGFNIGALKTSAFVPFADMINHRRPKSSFWVYDV
jgi:protein-histidine N-methyltransferase